MSNPTRLCPICHRHVEPTRGRNIAGHLDHAGHPCPASFELSIDLAITDERPTRTK